MSTVVETKTPPIQFENRLQVGVTRTLGVDVDALEADLRARIHGEVRFSDGDRALYATDGSNYRQVPIGVTIPRDVDDVLNIVAVARRHGAPILGRGCGTSLAGQCCNTAVVLDFTKYMHHVLEIDPHRRLGRVQPGCVLDDLRDAARKHGLTFGPDPATHSHCTLGGMLGNNSCGIHSLLSARNGLGLRTSDNTHELEVLTYDGLRLRVGPTPEAELERIIRAGGRRGEIYARLKALRDRYGNLIRERMPKIPRRVSGYNLDELLPENGFNVARALVGSESTCVIILEATLLLVPNPACRGLLVLGYPDIADAGDAVPDILRHQPTGLEGIDQRLFDWVRAAGSHPGGIKEFPRGSGFLLVEFSGDTKEDVDHQIHRLMDELKKGPRPPFMKYYEDKEEEEKVWKIREGGLGSTAWVPGHPDTWPGWEDSAVSPDRVGPYLRDLRQLMARHGYRPSLYGHLGQGCIHCRVGFDLYTAEGIRNFRSFMEEAADLVARYGGSCSGEHGDGQARAELLPRMYGEEMVRVFEEFKAIWDPEWKMNPGKVVAPNRLDANLRLGTDYHPPRPETHFKFPEDHYDFARAALRCVGVGECRKEHSGTMCPSYMVTREEKDTTRGRAHLLFEMLRGDPLQHGWKSDYVREALDLCLACKGCKGECPVHVDMATYKAEFLSHYYEGRLRPRHAYAMGLIYWWARLAAYAPRLVNLVTHLPLVGNLVKLLGGISQRRRMPSFAPVTFKEWFRRRGPRNEGRPPVILWPDTFNNYFHPQVGQATVEVLEHAGFQVLVPEASLCCGRPLYDFGMLDTAEKLLVQVLDALRPHVRAGTPVVGMEPSCVAVFRDELCNLFPHDEDAQRLKKSTLLLSEFLEQQGYRPPRLDRRAVVHGHCHHKALMKMTAETQVLDRMGLDYRVLDDGCCGMAGSFGFEAEHYDVSLAVGNRVLLPAVREAAKDTLIVSNGFSCKEQIEQTTDRKALHLAQVIQMALREGPAGHPGGYPERAYDRLLPEAGAPSGGGLPGGVLLAAGALAAGGALLWWMNRNRNR